MANLWSISPHSWIISRRRSRRVPGVNGLFWLVRLTTISVLADAAIWLRSSRHWFVGAAGIAALDRALTLPIAAYDLLIVLLVQAVVVIVVLKSAGWLLARSSSSVAAGSRPGRFRIRPTFSLLDLGWMTVLAAVLVWIAVRIPDDAWQQWQHLVINGLAHAMVTLIAYGLVARRWPWLRTGLAIVCFPALPLAIWLTLLRSRIWPDEVVFRSAKERPFAGARSIAQAAWLDLMLVPPVAMYARLLTPHPIPVESVPNPNGLDDVIAAGKTWYGIRIPDETNTEPFRGVLGPACRVGSRWFTAESVPDVSENGLCQVQCERRRQPGLPAGDGGPCKPKDIWRNCKDDKMTRFAAIWPACVWELALQTEAHSVICWSAGLWRMLACRACLPLSNRSRRHSAVN